MASTRSARQQSILESVACGEVGYLTLLGGFYFNRPLQLQLADQDQDFLKALYASGKIWHKPLDGVDFEVCLRDRDEGEGQR